MLDLFTEFESRRRINSIYLRVKGFFEPWIFSSSLNAIEEENKFYRFRVEGGSFHRVWIEEENKFYIFKSKGFLRMLDLFTEFESRRRINSIYLRVKGFFEPWIFSSSLNAIEEENKFYRFRVEGGSFHRVWIEEKNKFYIFKSKGFLQMLDLFTEFESRRRINSIYLE